MINPATKLICFLFFVKNLITFPLHLSEIIENANKGVAIPIPKKTKFNKLIKKSVVDELMANKIIKEAGLQGRTITPKKIPNKNELSNGFFKIGEDTFGNIFEKS